MGDQPAHYGVGVLGVVQVPGAVELVQAREGKAGGVADVVQPCGGFQQIGVSADLRIYWDEMNGRIAEAWCQGTMYRGYEMILIGRYPDDALATTALCGICSTSHVVAATHALEDARNITPPPQAVCLRNLFLAAESVMSDARQGALSFGPGLCDQSFSWNPLSPGITDAFQPPFAGWLTRQVRDFSKRILGASPLSPASGRIQFRSAQEVRLAR